jgi:cell division protein FtsQ
MRWHGLRLPALGAPSGVAARLRGQLRDGLHNTPRRRGVALALAAALSLTLAYWFWFRDSSFTSVQSVQISGVNGPQARAIESALRRTAKGMSTLDYSSASLQTSVASYPQVRTLRVTASFPHTMRIAVIEQLPAAALVAPSGARTAAAADGALLGGGLATGSLPTVSVNALPRRRVREAQTLAYLSVLGAAPAPMLGLLARAYASQKGITVQLRDGLLVYFGDATRPSAKWLAFARALLAAGSTEAAYVDVRAPERPAVGALRGSAGTGAAASEGTSTTGAGAGASAIGGTEGSLIAGLQAIVTGAGGATPLSSTTPNQAQGEPPAGGQSEAGGPAPAGTPEGESSGAGSATGEAAGAAAGTEGEPAASPTH